MNIKFMFFIIVYFSSLVTISCSGTKVRESWSDQGYAEKFKNVYIIVVVNDDLKQMIIEKTFGSRLSGISKHDLVRISLENTFRNRLAEEGIKSTPSHADFSKNLKDDRKTIFQKMENKGCDSVLVVKMNDQQTKATFTSGGQPYRYIQRRTLSSDQDYDRLPYYDNRWYNYISRMSVVTQPPEDTRFIVLTVESVLYDLQTEKPLWSVRMETDLEGNLEGMMQKLVDEAVKDLKVNGLL